MKFKNKIVLITGASRGIGQSIALEFAKEGATIIVNYLHSEKEANKVVEKIKRLNSNAFAIKADVSRINELALMVEKIIEKFKRIDILINNAGVFYKNNFFESNEEIWDAIIDINLKGVFFCSNLVAKHMLKQGYGKIINISSVSGIKQRVSKALEYGIAKAGVIYFTKSLALVLAPHINVNCIAPGYTATDMIGHTAEGKLEKEKEIPLKRMNKPEDIAKAVLFLASDDSKNITGQILVIDGGSSLK